MENKMNINFHSIICKQHLNLPLFVWASSLKNQKIPTCYALIYLQGKFGFSESKARLIAELAGLNSNQWGF